MQRSLPALIALALLFSTVGWSADSVQAGKKVTVGAVFWKGLEAYQNGDYETALREWRPLAEQGHAEAQFWLGVMYYEEKGVPQDYQTAVKWLRSAAQQEHTTAQKILGGMYYEGQGVDKNLVYAYMWLDIAASQEDRQAAKARDRVAKEMTRSQIERAQDLAGECVEKKKLKGCD
tara:strand:- start:70 stop:597 length:528 start_codon:yes stop_codon:yes gene_type:complete